MSRTSAKTSSPTLDALRSRPRDHARSLASAVIDDALSRKVSSLIDPDRLAKAYAAGLRATAEAEGFEEWLEARVAAAHVAAHDRFDGTLEEHLAPEVKMSLRRFSSRPFKADPALVRSVLRHRRVRAMLGEGLRDLLTDFGKSLLSAMPMGRVGALSGLMDVAKSMAGVVRAELDRQLEGRVKEFVDETLDRGIDKWTASLSTEARAKKSAQTRAVIFDVIMEQPVRHFLALPKTADLRAMCSAVAEELRALARWEGLEKELASSIRVATESFEDETVADLFEGSGLIESWRPAAESLLADHFAGLFDSKVFAGWVTSLDGAPAAPKKKAAAPKKS